MNGYKNIMGFKGTGILTKNVQVLFDNWCKCFFLIISSIFINYFHSFLQWIPPQLSVEVLLSLFVTYILLRTKVRTFVKRADIPFLLPLEAVKALFF